MHKFILALSFLALVACGHPPTLQTLDSVSAALIAPLTNLVSNGEFSNNLSGWTKSSGPGQMSLAVGRTGAGNALQIAGGAWVQQTISIKGSRNYRLTLWGRNVSGTTCSAGLRGGPNKTQTFRQTLTFSGVWEAKVLLYTVPANASWAGVFFEQTANASCQFDSVVLEDLPKPVSQTVSYASSDESFFNPERGYRVGIQLGHSINSTNLDTNWTWDTVRGLDAQGQPSQSVVQAYISLQNFKAGGDLSTYITQLRPRFEQLRAYHLKAVIRLWYSWKVTFAPVGQSYIEPDATMDTIRDHIRQLTPFLRDYADVILVVQRGFLGAWGEGTYSTGGADFAGVNIPPTPAQKQEVANLLMQALPTERRVQVRYVNELRSFIHDPATLSDANAYDPANPASRLALNNDCFMLRRNDAGTFQTDWLIKNAADDVLLQQDRTYLAQLSRYTPIGGEMCQWDLYPAKDELGRYDTSATADTPTNISNTLAELERYHWSWIAGNYGPGPATNPNAAGVIIGNWWANWGIRDQIGRRLGYRLTLTQSVAPNIVINDRLQMSFNLTNQGFAAPFNPRLVRLILRNTTTLQEYSYPLSVDPRKWQPGSSQTVNVDVTLPLEMRKQTYQVFVNLPDPYPTLSAIPDYAIRLANAGVWEGSTGYNKLGHTIEVW